MSPAVIPWRPLRVVLGAAGLVLLWFVLVPSSAEADDTPTSPLSSLTAGVTELVTTPVKETVVPTTTSATTTAGSAAKAATRVVTKPVASSVDTTTDVVDEVVAATPVAPTLEPVTAPVTSGVDHTTSTVTTTVEEVVDTATSRADEVLDETIGTVVDAVDGVVGADDPVVVVPGDGAADPVAGNPPTSVDPVDRGAERAAGVTSRSTGATTTATSRPSDAWIPAAAAVVRVTAPQVSASVARTVDALGGAIPAPSQPLPYLVSALLAGAAAASFSGRGPLAAGWAITSERFVLPRPTSAPPRAALVPVVAGPALRPGSRPD